MGELICAFRGFAWKPPDLGRIATRHVNVAEAAFQGPPNTAILHILCRAAPSSARFRAVGIVSRGVV